MLNNIYDFIVYYFYKMFNFEYIIQVSGNCIYVFFIIVLFFFISIYIYDKKINLYLDFGVRNQKFDIYKKMWWIS